jgi:predicted nucleic acid-binding protein
MTATSFIDTNILLYAASNAAADQAKRQVARGLLTRPDLGFSAQVLQEFYAAAFTKQRLQMTHDEAVAVLHSLAAFPKAGPPQIRAAGRSLPRHQHPPRRAPLG